MFLLFSSLRFHLYRGRSGMGALLAVVGGILVLLVGLAWMASRSASTQTTAALQDRTGDASRLFRDPPAGLPSWLAAVDPQNTDDEINGDDSAGEGGLIEELGGKSEQNYSRQRLTPDLLERFLLADVTVAKGQLAEGAQRWYELARDTRDMRAVTRAVQLAFTAQDEKLLYAATQIAHQLKPDEPLVQRLWVIALMKSGHLKEAETELRTWLANNAKSTPSLFTDLYSLWSVKADREQIAALTERLAAPYPKLPEAHFAVALVWESVGKNDAAVAAIDRALALRPAREDWLLYRARLNQRKDPAGTIRFLQDAIRQHPQSIPLHHALARALLDAQRVQDARALYPKLGAGLGATWLGAAPAVEHGGKVEHTNPVESSTAPNTVLVLPSSAEGEGTQIIDSPTLQTLGEALAALELRDYPMAETRFQQLLQGDKMPKESLSRLNYAYAVALESQQKHLAAQAAYRAALDGTMHDAALGQLIRLASRAGQRKDVRTLLDQVPRRTAGEYSAYVLTEARAEQMLKNLPRARTILDQALTSTPNQPDWLYERSLIADLQGDFVQAERDMRRYLVLQPDSTQGMNGLGYLLADRTTRFEEAERLIRRAIAQEPNSAAIQDSLGWVLARQGKYPEALPWLERAFSTNSDPTISAHYGEALWKLGDRDTAQRVWNDGLQVDPQDPVLQETIQRLGGRLNLPPSVPSEVRGK